MIRKLRLILIILSATVLLAASFLMVRQSLEYRKSESAQTGAVQTAAVPTPPPASEKTEPPAPIPQPPAEAVFLQELDIPALQAVNPDVLGWIYVPDTGISYPLLQGTDNEYYLYHTWDHKKSSLGAIFLECQAQPDFSDFNTIIYGHNMLNDSMFCPLLEYKTQSHFESHPTFYIADQSGIRRYAVFAAFEAGITSPVYRLGIVSTEAKQIFLDFCKQSSLIETEITPTTEDAVVTLSTCMGTGQHKTRWVVQGLLTDLYPPAAAAPAAAH